MSSPSNGHQRKIEYVPLGQIQKARRNPKRHALTDLQASIVRFGYADPLVLDERTGRLVAGHGRLEALEQLQREKAEPPSGIEVNPKGEWCVPVIRGWASSSDTDAEAFLVAANRLSEKGAWDQEQLADLLGDLGEQLQGTGFEPADLSQLLEELEATEAAAADAPDPDQVPPEPRKLWVKEGELYQVGNHFLLAGGDSHRAEDRARLFEAAGVKLADTVITDPPYAIYGSATGIGTDIADDKMVRPFFDSLCRILFDLLPLFGHAYTFCDWRTWPAIWDSAKRATLRPMNLLIWDKGGSGLGTNWANTYECVGYLTKPPAVRAMKSSQRPAGWRAVKKPNVLRFNRPSGDEREHNAAKPVGLLRELVTAGTWKKDQVVFEPFCGSGSTLIAAELEGRRCLAIDLEPKWIQVTLERASRVCGLEAKKVKP